MIVWRWDSEPFGTAAANQDPDGDGNLFVYNPRFPGQYYDAETGLNYNYHRDYDPGTGRYVESDPIGLNGGSYSTYAYGGGSPVNNIDPSGNFVFPVPPPVAAPVAVGTIAAPIAARKLVLPGMPSEQPFMTLMAHKLITESAGYLVKLIGFINKLLNTAPTMRRFTIFVMSLRLQLRIGVS